MRRGIARGFGVAAIAALPWLAGCADMEGMGGRSGLATAAARLPDEAAGFRKGRTIDYERERPGYGVGVDYATGNRAAVATVSLYDRGRSSIGSDPAGSDVQTELRTAVQEASESTVVGRSARRFTASGTTTLALDGSPAMACTRLQGTFGRAPVRRLVCVGVAGGRYVRVQVTQPDRGAAGVDADAFAVAMLRAARGR